MKYSDKKLKYFPDESQVRKSDFDRYQDMLDDHEENESLMGHPPSEFDPGLALDVHEDSFHARELSRIHTDQELEKVISELLHNTKKINARDVTVSVNKTNVKLSGSVRSQFDRDYAISLVKLIHGIGNIKSDIIVKLNPGILPTDIGRNP
jgi:hypothetical protein